MSKSEVQVLDFDKICRLCLLEKRSMSSIFSKKKSDKKVPLPVRIMSCASLELYEGDGLPSSICNKCLLSVNQSYAFREQCEQADTTLRQYAQRLQEASEEASTNNEEIKKENQRTAEDKGLPAEGIDVTDDSNRTLNGENENAARKKRITHKKKKSKLEDCSFLEDEDEDGEDEPAEMVQEEPENESPKPINSKPTESVLGKFLQFYHPDDDVKMEGKSNANQDSGTAEEGNGSRMEDDVQVFFTETNDQRKSKTKKKEGEPGVYKCEHCPKVYPSQGGLSYHRYIYHSAKYTPPVCDICGKTFRIQKYLDSHKNTVHFKLKDHLCDLCGKDFSSKYGLKLHKIWHMGEKNFHCDVCGMRFSTVGKVNTHKQVHGGPKNYICEVCSRAFRWKKSLFTHMRTHSGERPYKCEHCDRTFSALWNMQQHVRIHTGERPYKCDVCGKAFALNASMKEHRNRHHKT